MCLLLISPIKLQILLIACEQRKYAHNLLYWSDLYNFFVLCHKNSSLRWIMLVGTMMLCQDILFQIFSQYLWIKIFDSIAFHLGVTGGACHWKIRSVRPFARFATGVCWLAFDVWTLYEVLRELAAVRSPWKSCAKVLLQDAFRGWVAALGMIFSVPNVRRNGWIMVMDFMFKNLVRQWTFFYNFCWEESHDLYSLCLHHECIEWGSDCRGNSVLDREILHWEKGFFWGKMLMLLCGQYGGGLTVLSVA